MSKHPYTPPVTDVEVITLELNFLGSANATGTGSNRSLDNEYSSNSWGDLFN